MSTFNGIIDEFPGIRIDYFRIHRNRSPPQACFLSHMHSDHLLGLESLKMPFVYCSAATKKILLRMEKYPHRINFAKGILESRKQTYKHLRSVLREVPLETPVEIELDPKSRIRVTLFDANHCPGAVMFLIEGNNKAILYTGDVRAESWWVNSIVRNPLVLPYCSGVRKLDCIYLDTTFASREDMYEQFPSKAEGLEELLAKVSKCPKDSVFYFRSWTLGYEDVWIALSNFLCSPVHVDDYQLRIFRTLADDTSTGRQAASLAGFRFGNHYQPGCLTEDLKASIHSCEPGMSCHKNLKSQGNLVWITPIISRLNNGTEVAEMGAGGGYRDLFQVPELEMVDQATLLALETLFAENKGHSEGLLRLREMLTAAQSKGLTRISLDGIDLEDDEEMSIKEFIRLLSSHVALTNNRYQSASNLQRVIHFPYSRHSSYSELRNLVSMFKPRDICPCTVDIDSWSEESSMQYLFGDLCHEKSFKYDQEARSTVETRRSIHEEGRGKKRKRNKESEDDIRMTSSPEATYSPDLFVSAETSLNHKQDAAHSTLPNERNLIGENQQLSIPRRVEKLHSALAQRFEQGQHLDTGTSAGAENTGSSGSSMPIVELNPKLRLPSPDEYALYETQSTATKTNEAYKDDTATSCVPVSILQPLDFEDGATTGIQGKSLASGRNIGRDTEIYNAQDWTGDGQDEDKSIKVRKNGYLAARRALESGEHDVWTDLRLRSTGWMGHSEEETLL